jgi:hypothetical protein
MQRLLTAIAAGLFALLPLTSIAQDVDVDLYPTITIVPATADTLIVRNFTAVTTEQASSSGEHTPCTWSNLPSMHAPYQVSCPGTTFRGALKRVTVDGFEHRVIIWNSHKLSYEHISCGVRAYKEGIQRLHTDICSTLKQRAEDKWRRLLPQPKPDGGFVPAPNSDDGEPI